MIYGVELAFNNFTKKIDFKYKGVLIFSLPTDKAVVLGNYISAFSLGFVERNTDG